MTGHTSTVAGNASKMHVVHVFVKVFSVSRGPYPRHQAVWGGEKKTPQAVWWRGGKKKRFSPLHAPNGLGTRLRGPTHRPRANRRAR